jgi:hypothetical protein
MTRLGLALLAACFPAAAYGFTQCDVRSIGGPGAAIYEEGSNPVVSGRAVYAGFVLDKEVVVLSSNDGGKTFGAPFTVSERSRAARHIRLAADKNRVYAVWQQGLNHQMHLFLRANLDYGSATGWREVVDLGASSNDIPQVSADESNVHVIYVRDGDRIAIVSSTDSGRTFGKPVVLGKGSGEVVVTSYRNNVYAAWETGEFTERRAVMFAASHDFGKTFTIVNLSEDGARHAREPIFALDRASGRLSLVWREDTPVQVVYLQSMDGGLTWTPPLVVDQDARQGMVADDGANIYVTYLKEFRIGGVPDWEVHVAVSNDGGKTFPQIANISGESGLVRIDHDDDRPIPWAREGKFRVTGIEADGVHIWGGRNGNVTRSVYLGRGTLASPQGNVALWQAPHGRIDFAKCH